MLPQTAVALGLLFGDAIGSGAERLGRALDEKEPEAVVGTYEPSARAVSNWRGEASSNLDPGIVATLAAWTEAERPVVTRCVKLNNYWCIKSARWNGEIGTDEEGHVGFASAARGADAAATLLRRYYLEFGRRSALDIVRRWAPAECVAVAGAAPLATRGVTGTVRARYLASRTRTSTSRRATPPTPRVSAVAPRPVPAFRVPDVALGLGDKPRTISSQLPYRMPVPSRAAKPVTSPEAPAAPTVPPPPRIACASDEQRIRNYAGRIAGAVALGPGDDLRLFEANGMPTDNLAPVLLAMSSFELGTLRAATELVDGAVERQRERARALPDLEAGAP